MNRRITLLLVAAVTTILPAVAVADVMITGNVSIVGTQNTPIFYLQPGPNYPSAHAIGAIDWSPVMEATYNSEQVGPLPMATFDLEGIANQTTALANVLDLNITINQGVTGILYLNFTGNFPAGALVWITSSQVTVNDVMSGVGGQPLNSASFTFSGPFNGGTTTYYISFYLPPSASYAGSTGTITGTFVAS